MSTLSANAFEMLLLRLDDNPDAAGEKYELLRLKLIKCLSWKGCPESRADALADEVLDRVAMKITSGEQVANLTAYACEVLRYVWLEYARKAGRENTPPTEDLPETLVDPDISIFEDPYVRLNCLRICLDEVVPDLRDRNLIVGYYDVEEGQKNKDRRKELAVEYALTMTTLKVKACRIRAKLETCINECVTRKV